MTVGLRIRRANNAVAYSSDSVTWNQVGFFIVPGNGSVSYNFPVIAGREVLTAQMMIDPPPLNRRAVAHTITVSGTTVTASGGSEQTYVLVLMR